MNPTAPESHYYHFLDLVRATATRRLPLDFYDEYTPSSTSGRYYLDTIKPCPGLCARHGTLKSASKLFARRTSGRPRC